LNIYFRKDQTGYVLGHAKTLGPPCLERNMNPSCCTVIRLLLHMSMFIGCTKGPQVITYLLTTAKRHKTGSVNCIVMIQFFNSFNVSPMKWKDILFLAPLFVCLSIRLSDRQSVCPSHFRVRSISFKALVGFTNNFAQMSSMMRRCAVPMFDQGRFMVKVTI